MAPRVRVGPGGLTRSLREHADSTMSATNIAPADLSIVAEDSLERPLFPLPRLRLVA